MLDRKWNGPEKNQTYVLFLVQDQEKYVLKKKDQEKYYLIQLGDCTFAPLQFENSFSHFEEKIIYFRQSPHFFNFRQKPPLKYLKIILISNDRPTKVAIIKIYFRQNPPFFQFSFLLFKLQAPYLGFFYFSVVRLFFSPLVPSFSLMIVFISLYWTTNSQQWRIL